MVTNVAVEDVGHGLDRAFLVISVVVACSIGKPESAQAVEAARTGALDPGGVVDDVDLALGVS